MKNFMKNQKFNLIKIFLLKEKVFWKRTWAMHTKFNWFAKFTAFPIALIVIAIFHYAFAFMHFMFECFLWIFIRGQFELNMRKMQKQLSI